MKQTSKLVLAMLLLAAATADGCRKNPPIPRVTVKGHTFRVEVADTPAAWQMGLGGRSSLADDAGMLFVFPDSAERVFHMQDCYFPIDVAFLDADGTIINLESMSVEPDPSAPRRQYLSARPARYVLETVGGTWKRLGVTVGEKVDFADVF